MALACKRELTCSYGPGLPTADGASQAAGRARAPCAQKSREGPGVSEAMTSHVSRTLGKGFTARALQLEGGLGSLHCMRETSQGQC